MRAKELKFLRWKRRRQNRVCFEVFVRNERSEPKAFTEMDMRLRKQTTQ